LGTFFQNVQASFNGPQAPPFEIGGDDVMTSPDHAGNSSKKRVSSFNPQDIVPNPKKSPQRHVSSYIKHLLDEFRRSPTLTSKPKGRMKPLNITSVTDSGSTGHPSTPPKDMFHGEMVIFLLSALNGILI